jgi:hypothetical protein
MPEYIDPEREHMREIARLDEIIAKEKARAKNHIADLFSHSRLFQSNVFQPVNCFKNRYYKIIRPDRGITLTDQDILECNFEIEEVDKPEPRPPNSGAIAPTAAGVERGAHTEWGP